VVSAGMLAGRRDGRSCRYGGGGGGGGGGGIVTHDYLHASHSHNDIILTNSPSFWCTDTDAS